MTPALCLLEVVNGKPKVRLQPDEVVNRRPGIDYERLMLEPGDGNVTRSSLLAHDRLDPEIAASFPTDQVIFVCEPHAQLASNVNFQDNLLNQLLYPWSQPADTGSR